MTNQPQTPTTSPGNTANNAGVPVHVAIIMDGNGRWALSHGMDRSDGHTAGVDTVHRITEAASDLGIKYLTLYTFSTENWSRPTREVELLMRLIVTALERETPELVRKNVRLSVIGDMSRVPEYTRNKLNGCIAATAHCTGLNLILAISYSARWELTQAAKAIAAKAAAGQLNPDDIDADLISDHLTTAGIPDPDLLIRTGGDMRISNFLLWQIAYSEIFVTDLFWPDFSVKDFNDAIHDFSLRQRRFGKTGQQVSEQQT